MNYRKAQAANHKKTNIVMAIYIAIFFTIGLIGETVSVYSKMPYNEANLLTAMTNTFELIFTGQHVPLFIIITTSIALIIIFATIKWGNRIMLSGAKYTLLEEKETLTHEEQQLVNIVDELVISSRLRFKPKLYIIEEDYMNAFASGWTEENSMVAITRGLMNKLNRSEIEAVMAHEMAHVKNADVRLTLMVGVLTNVMVYAVEYLFYKAIGRGGSDNKAVQQAKIVIIILRFLLPLITLVLQMYISRTREYLADAGSVEFTGNKDAMISALQKISNSYKNNDYEVDDEEIENKARRYAYFFDPSTIFSTHPSVEKRIEALS